jgi:hypothetical protein
LAVTSNFARRQKCDGSLHPYRSIAAPVND